MFVNASRFAAVTMYQISQEFNKLLNLSVYAVAIAIFSSMMLVYYVSFNIVETNFTLKLHIFCPYTQLHTH
jgi:hypothetical protein